MLDEYEHLAAADTVIPSECTRCHWVQHHRSKSPTGGSAHDDALCAHTVNLIMMTSLM